MDLTDIVVAAALCGEGGGGGAEQIPADWNQTDPNAKDFIKNKPFDVTTSGQMVLFDGVLDECNQEDFPNTIWHMVEEGVFSKEDVGKILVFTVNDHVFEAEIRLLYEGAWGYYIVAQSDPYDPSEEHTPTFPSVEMLCSYDVDSGQAATVYNYYDDRVFVEGDSVPCKVTMDNTVTTKLPIEKTNVSWNNLPDKPFDIETNEFIIDGTEPAEEFGYTDWSPTGFNNVYFHVIDLAYEKVTPEYGDIITINYNGKTLSGIFSKRIITGATELSYLCDAASNTEDLNMTSNGIVFPGNIDNAFAFTRRVYLEDEEIYEIFSIAINDSEFDMSSTEPITITMTKPIVSKLSGDKIKIDGETIVSDDGILKAVPSGGIWTPVDGSGTSEHDTSTKALVYPEDATQLLIGVNYHGLATSVIYPLSQYDSTQTNFVMLGFNGNPLEYNQIAAKIRIDDTNKKIWIKAFSASGDGWSNGQANVPNLTLLYQ